jgi:hypothetical protein
MQFKKSLSTTFHSLPEIVGAGKVINRQIFINASAVSPGVYFEVHIREDVVLMLQ